MTLVFDTAPLSHFARANRMHELDRICGDHRRVVTQAVRDELERGEQRYAALADVIHAHWLEVEAVSSLPELQAFAEYARRLGSGARHIGEASTLAWAEVHGAIAILDERAGTIHGRARDVEVHGTLWLVAQGYRNGVLDEMGARALVDALRDTEAWFPCDGATFFEWARSEGLLP